MSETQQACGAVLDPTRCIMRGQIHESIDSFRRELSGYAKAAAELRAAARPTARDQAFRSQSMGALQE